MTHSLTVKFYSKTVTLEPNPELTEHNFHYYSINQLWEKLSLTTLVHPDKWFEEYAGLYYCNGCDTQAHSDNPEDYDEDGSCWGGETYVMPHVLHAYLYWACPELLEHILKDHYSDVLDWYKRPVLTSHS